MTQPHLRHINKEELVDRLMEEIKGLKQDLIEFGRHSPGCPNQYDKKYHCKCGWLKVEQALKETK